MDFLESFRWAEKMEHVPVGRGCSGQRNTSRGSFPHSSPILTHPLSESPPQAVKMFFGVREAWIHFLVLVVKGFPRFPGCNFVFEIADCPGCETAAREMGSTVWRPQDPPRPSSRNTTRVPFPFPHLLLFVCYCFLCPAVGPTDMSLSS